jgi:hypothetical protein
MHILRMRTNNMERRSFAKDIARTKEENDGLGACAAVRFLHKGHCLIIISVPGRQRTVPYWSCCFHCFHCFGLLFMGLSGGQVDHQFLPHLIYLYYIMLFEGWDGWGDICLQHSENCQPCRAMATDCLLEAWAASSPCRFFRLDLQMERMWWASSLNA